MYDKTKFFDADTHVSITAARLQINSSQFNYTDNHLVITADLSRDTWSTEEPHDPLD